MRIPKRNPLMWTPLAALAVCAAANADDALFAPPPITPPSADASQSRTDVAVAPLRVAWTAGVEAGFQPAVGRFGGMAPPPLPEPTPVFLPATPPAGELQPAQKPTKRKAKQEPKLPEVEHHPPLIDRCAVGVACDTGDFSADAFFAPYDACDETQVYGGKFDVDVQRPLVEWGMPFYGPGPVPPSSEILGPTNPVNQKFYLFGDYRVGLAQNNLVGSEETFLAHRLNLEADYWITGTERVHMFVGPFQEDADFMRVVDGEYFEELDLFQADTDTLFFEGDLGQILGGLRHEYAAFDLPFAVGLVPLLFQNGVWAFDAVVGGAVTLPARNSPTLDWSNFDVTLFAAVDRVSSGAFNFEESPGGLYGATTFIETRGGYLELGYGFVDDSGGDGFGYHNLAASYTRRYANTVSNSVRVIVNTGQDPNGGARQTADGVLLLVENSLITHSPYNVVPYVNFFAGFDRPQPLARAGVFGGVLFNTGILFQVDQLTSYPTLDATANDTVGVAMGVDLLAPGFDQQLIFEAAMLHAAGDPSISAAAGDQAGLGFRWQKQLSTSTLLRADAMIGWLDNSDDIAGARIEYRWKF